jgi:hypothetical protein
MLKCQHLTHMITANNTAPTGMLQLVELHPVLNTRHTPGPAVTAPAAVAPEVHSHRHV